MDSRPTSQITEVKCQCGIPIASDYQTIVHGKRGSYLEFTSEQIIQQNIWIPPEAQWRLLEKYQYAYYTEWRSKCKCNTKIYHQRRTVKYADYKVGLWYVAEEECILENGL